MGSLDLAQDAVIARMEQELAQPVHEVSVPDSTTLIRNSDGEIDPYFAVQFGDLQLGLTKNMATTTGDDYSFLVYIEAVAPTAPIARRLGNRVNEVLLGYSPPWCGQLTKRSGGLIFPLTASNAAVEAYMMPASFATMIQFSV